MDYDWIIGSNLVTYNSIRFIQEEIVQAQNDLKETEDFEEKTLIRKLLYRLECIEVDLNELIKFRQNYERPNDSPNSKS